MSFRWADLQKVALQLAEGNASEAHLRSSINRAYYAAYGEARDFVTARGYTWNRKGASHQQVWDFLRKGGAASPGWALPAWKAVGDMGVALKQQRTLADYSAAPAPTKSQTQLAITQAQLIIKRLAGLP